MKTKNNRGFTLVEIIICLVLIIGIGTVSVVTITKKENSKLEDITNKIIEATNVYINTEKDDQGNYYSYGINNGAKGVQISVKTLEETGYISKGIVTTLEKESGKKIEDGLYVFISNSIKNDTDQECSSGMPQSYTVSWKSTDEPIYLCPYESFSSGGSSSGCKVFNDEKAIYNKILNQSYETDCTSSTTHTGFCYLKGQNYVDNNVGIYYYKGKVKNNYLKFAGLDKLFRIVRTTENNSIKIVEDDTIESTINYSLIDNIGMGCFFLPDNMKDEVEVVSSYKSGGVWWTVSKIGTENYGSYGTSYKGKSYMCMKNFKNASSIQFIVNYQGKPYSQQILFDETTLSFDEWNDTDEVEFYADFSAYEKKLIKSQNVKVKSPIYRYYYEPLNSHYVSEIKNIIENNLDKDYKWCITSGDYFKCGSSKEMSSDFGLLNYFEYEMINYIAHYSEHSIYGHALSTSQTNQKAELTMDLSRTFGIGSYGGCIGCGADLQYFRPAYVIKGNSKIISGDGTIGNPYVVSGLTD